MLLSDLEQAGLIERDQNGGIAIVVPPETFGMGVGDLVAKLKTFRYEGERRLRLIADYAQSKECRSVFLRRYFGEEHPPRCGTGHATAAALTVSPRLRRQALRGSAAPEASGVPITGCRFLPKVRDTDQTRCAAALPLSIRHADFVDYL